MKYTKIFLAIIFSSLGIFVNIPVVNSQNIAQNRSCLIPRVTPKRQTRKINRFGVSFHIPANYQTEISSGYPNTSEDRTITLLNPAHLQMLACCEKNQLVGCGHEILTVAVNIRKTPLGVTKLDDIFKKSSPEKSGIIKKTRIANQSAIIYYVIDLATEEKNIYATFFTPDKKQLIDVYYPENYRFNQQVFNTVVSSFSLSK